MKEFKVSNEDIVLYVKEVRDELHATNRFLVIVHRFGDNDSNDVFRLVEPYKLMDVVSSYFC